MYTAALGLDCVCAKTTAQKTLSASVLLASVLTNEAIAESSLLWVELGNILYNTCALGKANFCKKLRGRKTPKHPAADNFCGFTGAEITLKRPPKPL